MTDPALLESLRGQQYLVLRPVSGVAAFYDEEADHLNIPPWSSLPHPNAGHVTLRGFFEPHRVGLLRDALARWAGSQPPVDLRVAAVDGFPTPFQIVIARLDRSPSLVAAYASLTAELDAGDFHRIGELPLEEWVFHLSLLYGGGLEPQQWDALHTTTRCELSPQPSERVTSAEFVWYDDDGEHSDILPFAPAGT
jgi:hypothetical protein